MSAEPTAPAATPILNDLNELNHATEQCPGKAHPRGAYADSEGDASLGRGSLLPEPCHAYILLFSCNSMSITVANVSRRVSP